MTKQDIATVVVRLLAIYCLVAGLPSITMILHICLGETFPGWIRMLIYSGVIGVILWISAFLLWRSASTVAAWMVAASQPVVPVEPADEAGGATPPLSPQHARQPVIPCNPQHGQAIAFSVVGVYLLGSHLPAALADIPKMIGYLPTALLANHLLLALLGLWLFLGARGFKGLGRVIRRSRLLQRVREFGLSSR